MESLQKHLYVAIHAGGGGTRLWPESRENSPKQFIRLFKGQSLLKLTFDRACQIVPIQNIIVTTSERYTKLVKKELPGLPAENIISEPIRRDTAVAYGLAALYLNKKDPESIVVNMASDHLISPLENFIKVIKKASELAQKTTKVVVIGIRPTYPHTGLGHIKAVKKWPDLNKSEILIGEKFVEKPPLALAEKYTESGHYYWNLNIFVWKSRTILDLLAKYAPKSYTFFPKLFSAIGTDKEREVFSQLFQMAPSISIEYAVINYLTNFPFIVADFNWSDVGDWNVVWQHLPKDQVGNVISGPAGKGQYIGINSQNNLLFLDKKVIATVGINDFLIVDTPDALLICPKSDAQGVKQVVQTLKDQNLTEYL